MECKTVPKIPETTVDLITQLDKKQGTSCSRYGFKFCLGILSCLSLAYCIYLHYSYINLLKQLQNIKENSESSNQPATMVKRHMDVEDRRHRRERRKRDLLDLKHKVHDLETLPMVHLYGNKGFDTTKNPHACRYDQPCFKWNSPFNTHDFEYESVGGKVVGVKITRAGYYYVYSQISVAGLKNEEAVSRSNPGFGYETIKVTNRINTTLSRSYVTQDERGQWYDQMNQIGPVDTMNQMGMFRLNCNDVIMIADLLLSRSDDLNNYQYPFYNNGN